MRRDFFNLLLVFIVGFNNLPCVEGEVLCPGKEPGEYCDCAGDCENYPDFCECDEAQMCCGNINQPSPITNPAPTIPSPTDPAPTNPAPTNPTPSPISQPGQFVPIYKDGTGLFKKCKKTTQVFSVTICYTQKAWDKGDKKKIDHIAHVLAQHIDNDADGEIDHPDLISYVVNNDMFMFVKYDESEQAQKPDDGWGQMTGLWEAVLNSCNVPSNRGASDTDRSTWSSAVENTPGSTQCNPGRDATVEEIHHLLADAAAQLYPDEWGTTSSSKAGSLVLALNGDCGWGNNWINPGGQNPKCTGTYAYNDQTCKEDCRIVEGVYWASISWIGGLYTSEYASDIGNEWLMTVPDSSMTALPKTYKNAATLEEGAPDLYNFISDTTSQTHLWLPRIMPNGVYGGKSNDNTNQPVAAPISNPTNDNDEDEDEDEDNDEDCKEDKATQFLFKYKKKKDKYIMKTCGWLQKQKMKKQNKICKKIDEARDECPVTCKAC